MEFPTQFNVVCGNYVYPNDLGRKGNSDNIGDRLRDKLARLVVSDVHDKNVNIQYKISKSIRGMNRIKYTLKPSVVVR